MEFGLNGRDQATIEQCAILANSHIVPLIGPRKLRDLSAYDVDRWLADRARVLSTRSLPARLHPAIATRRRAHRGTARTPVIACRSGAEPGVWWRPVQTRINHGLGFGPRWWGYQNQKSRRTLALRSAALTPCSLTARS